MSMTIMDDNSAEQITLHDVDELILDDSKQARDRLLAIFSNPSNCALQRAFSDINNGSEVSEARVYTCRFPKLLDFAEGGTQARNIIVLTLKANGSKQVFKGKELQDLIHQNSNGVVSLEGRKFPKLSNHQVESLATEVKSVPGLDL